MLYFRIIRGITTIDTTLVVLFIAIYLATEESE